MLTNAHMLAAHKLLREQFPGIQGCQSTLLEQNRGFSEVSGEGMLWQLYRRSVVGNCTDRYTVYLYLKS